MGVSLRKSGKVHDLKEWKALYLHRGAEHILKAEKKGS